MNRPTRQPNVTDDRYPNAKIYLAKHGELPHWHPAFRALTPVEWLHSPGTGVRNTQIDTPAAASETGAEHEVRPVRQPVNISGSFNGN